MSDLAKSKRKDFRDAITEMGDLENLKDEEIESKIPGLVEHMLTSLDFDKDKNLDQSESRSLINSIIKISKEITTDLSD